MSKYFQKSRVGLNSHLSERLPTEGLRSENLQKGDSPHSCPGAHWFSQAVAGFVHAPLYSRTIF